MGLKYLTATLASCCSGWSSGPGIAASIYFHRLRYAQLSERIGINPVVLRLLMQVPYAYACYDSPRPGGGQSRSPLSCSTDGLSKSGRFVHDSAALIAQAAAES